MRGWQRRASQTGLLFAGLLAAGSAVALITGTWTTNGSASATSNVSGITVTWAGNADQNYANGTFNTTTSGGWWTDPHGGTVAGGASLVMLHDSGTRNYTVTFSKAVDNPVLHIDRLGGAINSDPNTSRWTLGAVSATGGAVTMTELSGNPQFVLSSARPVPLFPATRMASAGPATPRRWRVARPAARYASMARASPA